MSEASPGNGSHDLGDLADHGRFVRNLAWRLLHDEDAAEEVVQETMLAAVKAQPDAAAGRSLRPWLATVARNVIRRRFRGVSRRRKREEAAAKPESLPGTADMVARAEMLKEVVDAVLSLDEPNRSTVLLRYYEDLPPREIAARQGVGVETVRGRLKRAVEQLRRRLDRRHPEGRAGWAPVLAALCGFELPAKLLGGTAGATAGAEAAPAGSLAPAPAPAVAGGLKGVAAAFLLGAAVATAGTAFGLAGTDAVSRRDGAVARGGAPATFPEHGPAGAPEDAATLQGRRDASERLAALEGTNRTLRARVAELREAVAALDPAPFDPKALRFALPEQTPAFDGVDWLDMARHVRACSAITSRIAEAVKSRGEISARLRGELVRENAPLAVVAVRIGTELGGLAANRAYTHPAVLANVIRAALVLVEDPLTRDQEVALRALGEAWAAEVERQEAAIPKDAPLLARLVAEVEAKLRFMDTVKDDVLTRRQRDLLFDPVTEDRLQLGMFTPGLLYNLVHRFAADDREDLERELLVNLFLIAGVEVEVEDLSPYAWVARRWVDEVPDVLTPREAWDEEFVFAHVRFAHALARAQLRAIERILDTGRLDEEAAEGLRQVTVLILPRICCPPPEGD